jgi:hypothetical protein
MDASPQDDRESRPQHGQRISDCHGEAAATLDPGALGNGRGCRHSRTGTPQGTGCYGIEVGAGHLDHNDPAANGDSVILDGMRRDVTVARERGPRKKAAPPISRFTLPSEPSRSVRTLAVRRRSTRRRVAGSDPRSTL